MRMIRIPGGKDPDELYSNGGAEAVAAAVNASVPWMEQFNLMLPSLYDMSTPVGRGQAAGFMASLFILVKNSVVLESYIREGAALLQVSEQALYDELSRLRNRERRSQEMRQGGRETQPAPAPQQRTSAVPSALLTLFALSVSSQENAREISDLLPPEAIDGYGVISEALNLLLAGAAAGEPEEEIRTALNTLLSEKNSSELGRILISPPVFADPVKALADSVSELLRISRRRRYTAVVNELRSCSDPQRRSELMIKLQELMKEK
jgi:DNA primase